MVRAPVQTSRCQTALLLRSGLSGRSDNPRCLPRLNITRPVPYAAQDAQKLRPSAGHTKSLDCPDGQFQILRNFVLGQ